MTDYDDIISLPHHISFKHPPMLMVNRAAQFAPFAALTGFGDAILETSRLTDSRRELDEENTELLNLKINTVLERISEKPFAEILYFRPDEKKAGGAYVVKSGNIRVVDSAAREVIFTDGEKIGIDDIFEIELL